MTASAKLGTLLQSFFTDHLITVKGLRPASVRSYRDTIRLFLIFLADQRGTKITRLRLEDLTFEHVAAFLTHLEHDRGNGRRTRNQRLAALHTLFDYIATREPGMLGQCQRIAAIPMKRVPPPETQFLERDEVQELMETMPCTGRHALRDRTLMLFLYNSGARAQEVADLRAGNLNLSEHPLVRLHGKGDKWRTCPLWRSTADQLQTLLDASQEQIDAQTPVFTAGSAALTRSGIYKIVRRHAGHLDNERTGRRVTPHLFRHTAAVHLLESGVEVNVIRAWLGHADLSTTNRYAQINTKAKQDALRATELPGSSAAFPATPIWRSDQSLLDWLSSL